MKIVYVSFCLLILNLAARGQNFIDTIYFETNGFDSYINSNATGTNYGTDTSLWVYYDHGSPYKIYYSYLKADLSMIPKSAVVLNASFNLYALEVNNGGTHPVTIQRLTSSWTEGGLTWSNAPTATSAGSFVLPHNETTSVGWHKYSPKYIVQYQIDHPNENFGYRLIQGTSNVDKGIKYASTEHSNSEIRPYMVLEYFIPETDTIYFENSKDARVYSGATGTNFGQDSLLTVDWTYSGTGYANRSFLYADLSSIDPSMQVSNADIFLFALDTNNSVSHPLYIEAVSSATWLEDSIKWSNQPSVGAAYRSGISHSISSKYGWQEMDIINLAKYAVWSPSKNKGWRISLQSEAGTTNYGIKYASAEHDSVELRPYVVVEYVPPIEMEAFVTHCTNGNNDGSIHVTSVIGGCQAYTNYAWRKQSGTSYTSIEAGSDLANIDISGLSDGVYVLEITDYRGIQGHKYFFVGEEGTTTPVSLEMSSTLGARFCDDAFVVKYKNTGDSTTIGGSATTVGCFFSPTAYDARSFVKLNIQWDPSLEITEFDFALKNKGGCKQYSNSDNDAWISRVTEPWGEYYVTWANRPGVSTEGRSYIPTTVTNGNENRNDTISILGLIPYWQEHPDENYGFELALNSYNQANAASRDYSSADYIGNSFLGSFTVKPKIETTFHDSLGVGDILVNAPAGELPFTYLIGYDTIPDLVEIWADIKDSTSLDSALFFQGKSNTRNFTFSGMTANKYFIAVYDNDGSKLEDYSVQLGPEVSVYLGVNIDETATEISVSSPADSAWATFLADLPEDEEGGFEFNVDNLDGVILIGFNKTGDTIPFQDRLFEYLIKIDSTGSFQVRKAGKLITTGTTSVGDNFKMVKYEETILVYHNNVEIYSDAYTRSDGAYKIEVQLKGPNALLSKPLLLTGMLKPKPIKVSVTQPDCSELEGTVQITLPNTYFKSQFISFSVKNLNTNTVVATGSTGVSLNLPIGVYSITWQYYQYIGGVLVSLAWSGYQEFVVGYPVDWYFLTPDDNITEISGTNTLTPTNDLNVGNANSLNSAPSLDDWWYSFNVRRSHGGALTWTYADLNLYSNEGAAMNLHVEPYSWSGAVTKFVQINGGDFVMIHNDLPFVIKSETAGFTVENHGNIILPLDGNPEPNPVSGSIAIGVEEKGKVFLSDNLASFCLPDLEADNSGYIRVNKTVDGGYYDVGSGILLFEVDVEYYTQANTYLEYAIYTTDLQLIAGVSNNGTTVVGSAPLLEINLDKNGFEIDLGALSIPDGYYILETTNAKGEKEILKFKLD